MTSTRTLILETLRTRHRATTAELVRIADVNPSGIRYHLRRLAAEGLVVRTGRRIVDGRGRPAEVYELADQPDNIAPLAGHLLDRDGGNETAMARLAAAFAPHRGDRSAHITQRLVAAMAILNRLNYQARWEPDPEGPQVIFGHCPFMEIIHEHPELCVMDRLMLERLTGEKADQVEKLVANNEGALHCRFAIRPQIRPQRS
jgi:predicted ArsR family transcriptional regulator